MPAYAATAPGKIILFGEHAVVYGHPAIAVPVQQVHARAMLQARPFAAAGEMSIYAPDIDLETTPAQLPADHPLAAALRLTLEELNIQRIPACALRITSTIPMAAGLGSGAAVSVAIIRAWSAFLGHPLPAERVCALAYEVEKLHHGTPSGIDNTVITYEQPVYFTKGQPIERLQVARQFTIVIGDTGIVSPTAVAVGDVRKAWQKHKDHYEALFDAAGAMAGSARQAIENGAVELLGPLMDANHGVLVKMGVSCPELDALVTASRKAGAWGAKLSGGGRGGNMIALVSAEHAEHVSQALLAAGAVRTITTQVA